MPAKDKFGALLNRLRRLGLWVGLGALAGLVLLSCGLRVYSVQLAHREVALLAEAAGIRIGASEASVLPMVKRNGGEKEMPEPPLTVSDCIVPAYCEVPKAPDYDYRYEVELSPFQLWPRSGQELKGFRQVLARLVFMTPSALREPLSMRASWIYVLIAIRGGRVESVSGHLFVEGRTRWLGHAWTLSNELPDPNSPQRTYAVDGATVTLNTGGALTVNHLTPGATPEQFEAAQSFYADCLAGLGPCRCLHDLSPRAFQYLDGHPDAGDVIQLEECPNPVRLGK